MGYTRQTSRRGARRAAREALGSARYRRRLNDAHDRPAHRASAGGCVALLGLVTVTVATWRGLT